MCEIWRKQNARGVYTKRLVGAGSHLLCSCLLMGSQVVVRASDGWFSGREVCRVVNRVKKNHFGWMGCPVEEWIKRWGSQIWGERV